MNHDLAAALCLVLVFEGLFLFAAPSAWSIAAPSMTRRWVGSASPALRCIVAVSSHITTSQADTAAVIPSNPHRKVIIPLLYSLATLPIAAL